MPNIRLNPVMLSEVTDQSADSADWISELPDSVLTHILSFLSTKQALHTCVLSKRWEKLWASVPALHFDFNEFLSDNAYYSLDEHARCEVKFHQFVNHVWQNRKVPQLDSFELFMENIKEHSDYSDATPWILQATECKPRIINVTLCRLKSFHVPDSVFTCASLESLQLSSEEFLRPKFVKPKMVSLPSLKMVRLASVTMDALFLEELLSGCPALETLKLAYCHLFFSKISSKSLKNLVIGECIMCSGCIEIEISTLGSLLLVQNVDQFSLKNTHCLVDTSMWDLKYGFYRSNILEGLVNVTKLLLQGTPTYQNKKEKEEAIANFPIFHNLRDLCIGGWCIVDDFHLVAAFLENSPNLQNLACFDKTEKNRDENVRTEKLCQEAESDMLYLREHLKLIEIRQLSNGGSVDELVRTLQACVKTIDEIIIVNSFGNLFSFCATE